MSERARSVTITDEIATASEHHTGTGRVVRVIGPVVDVEFSRDTMPALFNALTVEIALERWPRR